MAFIGYTPTPTKLVTLTYGDGNQTLSAATTNVSLEQLADAVAYCQGRVCLASSSIWYRDTEPPNVLQFGSTSYATNVSDATALTFTVAGIVTGDVIHVDASMCAIVPPTNVTASIKIGVTHGAGTEYYAPGLRQVGSSSVQVIDNVSFSSRFVATGSGTTRFRVLGKYAGAGGTFYIYDNAEIRVSVFRS